MSQPLSSPAIMATSTSPANNGILTEQQERPHSWTELGKTRDPLKASDTKTLMPPPLPPKPAHLSRASGTQPTPPGSPPVLPISPPSPPVQAELRTDPFTLPMAKVDVLQPSQKYSASGIESIRDDKPYYSSEIVSAPTATSLKAEPVVQANSTATPHQRRHLHLISRMGQGKLLSLMIF